MIIAIIGIIIGVIIGYVVPYSYNPYYSLYISMALLAAIDSVFGGLNAYMDNNFNNKLFLSGLIGNSIIAALLTWLGDILSITIYYAAIFVFGGRIFNNFATIRRKILNKM